MPGSRRAILGFLLALTVARRTAAAADADLLAASDPFARLPFELRAEVRLVTGPGATPTPVEIWRRGDDRLLIRFLAAKDRGKFLLRRDRSFFLLAPGARAPVALAPALGRAGPGVLDQLFAARPSRDYAIVSASASGGMVTFDLAARPGLVLATPRLRWVVDRPSQRPVRAELRGADDRVQRVIEFREWRDGARLEPRRLVIKDVARGGAPLEVELVTVEAREAAEVLFDLNDGAARKALPPPGSP